MAQASVSRQSIQEAVAALDAQSIDSDREGSLARAVAVARRALLLALEQDASPQLRQVAILIADLSGYTAIAEQMDAEQVREAINAMWLELDRVIADWGGRIDQHAGDSLVALFGLPWQRPFDAWRAVQAAQALQLALTSFNERVRQLTEEAAEASWFDQWPGPQMRVGVHEGPLAVAMEDGSSPLPVASDALRVAYELEEAASPGTILVSDAIQQQVQQTFYLEASRPRRARAPSFLVVGPKPQESDWQPAPVVDVLLNSDAVSHLVGRNDALDTLEDAFQRATDARTLEIVTLIGETGYGKTRLLQAFWPHLQLLDSSVTLLRTRLHEPAASRPYALLSNLLARYLDIYPSHSASAVRGRIAASRLLDGVAGDHQIYVEALEQLLLPGLGPVPPQTTMTSLAKALMVAAAGESALVILCDDLHHVDAYSLALLDSLLLSPVAAPVLFVGLAQPSLLKQPSAATVSWLRDLDDPFLPVTRITLPPLTAVESRLLVAVLLRPAAPVPQRLIDLIVADANGNPWVIEETIRQMIDLAIIVPGTRWQIDLARAEKMVPSRSLPEFVEVRLQQLPALDRQVIGAAAAVGSVFWDTAVMTLLADAAAEQEVLATLVRLAAAGWLSVDNYFSLGDAQGYHFARTLIQRATLETLGPEAREKYAARLAVWVRTMSTSHSGAKWLLPQAMATGTLVTNPAENTPAQAVR